MTGDRRSCRLAGPFQGAARGGPLDSAKVTGMGIRVLLADDQPDVLSALRLALEHEPDLKVVGDAVEMGDLLHQIAVHQPDLLLFDWELPGPRAEGIVGAVRRACPCLRVVAMSGRPEARRMALDVGADAFVSKGDPPERLLAALRATDHGGEA